MVHETTQTDYFAELGGKFKKFVNKRDITKRSRLHSTDIFNMEKATRVWIDISLFDL